MAMFAFGHCIYGCGRLMVQWNEDMKTDTILKSVQHWFEAWELVSQDVFG
jgi:hypothetical protein